MRHGKKFNHLSRTASHRSAMLSNMASSLIKHKRINTTVAKAKALRKFVEPIITKAKSDNTHSRREAFSYLQDKESVQELFSTVAEKVASRPGGYTRILKTGNRLGDNAEMCMMELVDFNELMLEEKPAKKSRRSRRGGKKAKSTEKPTEAKVENKEAEAETAEKEEETQEAKTEEAPEAKADTKEDSAEGQKDETSDEESGKKEK